MKKKKQTYFSRYKKLSIWNRIGIWASLITFLSLICYLLDVPNITKMKKLIFPKTISIQKEWAGEGDYIYLNIDSLPLSAIDKKKCDSVHTNDILLISITSESDNTQIDIAPFLIIKLLSSSSFPEKCVGKEILGKGAGGDIRIFSTVLSPNMPKLTGAPNLEFHDTNIISPKYQYYKLSPGEREFFELDINYYHGFIYKFKVGILYRYKNKYYTIWLPDTFKIGCPKNKIRIYEYFDYVRQGIKYDYMQCFLGGNHDEGFLKKHYNTLSKYMKKYNIFTIDLANEDE